MNNNNNKTYLKKSEKNIAYCKVCSTDLALSWLLRSFRCWRSFTSSKVKGRAHDSLSTGLTCLWGELDREILPSAAWEVIGQESDSQSSSLTVGGNESDSRLVCLYLGLSVVRMVPVVQSATLQDKVATVPHAVATQQLKHRL